jgi:FMN phosphatase YigB (HAD superfamily)
VIHGPVSEIVRTQESAPPPRMRHEALTFDMYGTLVDPLRIWQQLQLNLGEAAPLAAEVWRAKQLEYTFRLTAMQRYEDFEVVTRKSLDYMLAAFGFVHTHRTHDVRPRGATCESDHPVDLAALGW